MTVAKETVTLLSHAHVHVLTHTHLHTHIHYTYRTTPLTCFTLILPRTSPTGNTWHACGTVHSTVNPLAMETLLDRNSIGRLNDRKSIDRIIALRSITSIGALLDSNLLVQSACRSIGSHTNWLLNCGMVLSWFCYMYVYFSVSSCELSFVFCIPWSLKFLFLSSKFLKFISCPLGFFLKSHRITLSFWNPFPMPLSIFENWTLASLSFFSLSSISSWSSLFLCFSVLLLPSFYLLLLSFSSSIGHILGLASRLCFFVARLSVGFRTGSVLRAKVLLWFMDLSKWHQCS